MKRLILLCICVAIDVSKRFPRGEKNQAAKMVDESHNLPRAFVGRADQQCAIEEQGFATPQDRERFRFVGIGWYIERVQFMEPKMKLRSDSPSHFSMAGLVIADEMHDSLRLRRIQRVCERVAYTFLAVRE